MCYGTKNNTIVKYVKIEYEDKKLAVFGILGKSHIKVEMLKNVEMYLMMFYCLSIVHSSKYKKTINKRQQCVN